MGDRFLCGGKPSASDLAAVAEFERALALPTRAETGRAILDMSYTGKSEGDE